MSLKSYLDTGEEACDPGACPAPDYHFHLYPCSLLCGCGDFFAAGNDADTILRKLNRTMTAKASTHVTGTLVSVSVINFFCLSGRKDFK